MFDYGRKENRKRYNQVCVAIMLKVIFSINGKGPTDAGLKLFYFFIFCQDTPPVYNVTKMNTPTAFFYGGNDGLSNRTDVLGLIPEITNLKVNNYIAEYNHIDFVFGIDAPKVLYNRIFDLIDETVKEQ